MTLKPQGHTSSKCRPAHRHTPTHVHTHNWLTSLNAIVISQRAVRDEKSMSQFSGCEDRKQALEGSSSAMTVPSPQAPPRRRYMTTCAIRWYRYTYVHVCIYVWLANVDTSWPRLIGKSKAIRWLIKTEITEWHVYWHLGSPSQCSCQI